MITRIEIDGFKSFVDFELDVPPLLVLVGANNGGKSNLLQALDLYRDLQQGGPGFAFNRRGRGSAMFHRDVHGRERDEFTVAVATGGEAMSVRTVRDSRGSLAGFFPHEERNGDVDRWLLVELDAFMMRHGAERGSLVLQENGANVATVVAAMFENRDSDSAFGDLLMDLAAVLPGFADLVPVYDKRTGIWDLDFVFDTGRRLPCAMVSDGTLRVLGILTAIHSSRPSGTVLIDEIEVGFHPAILMTLMDRIQLRLDDDPQLQVITTTHSPVVVSRVLSQRSESVVFFDQVYGAITWPDGEKSPTERTRARHVAASGEPGHYVTSREVRRYLETVRSVTAP